MRSVVMVRVDTERCRTGGGVVGSTTGVTCDTTGVLGSTTGVVGSITGVIEVGGTTGVMLRLCGAAGGCEVEALG